ncbi:MAG: UpxY family transcription antiterminator [Bacteroidia bacterium]
MNTITDLNHWYAIYTKPRAEKKVFERLCEYGYEAYLPLVTSVREWSDRKKKVTSPLISGYVFVKINRELLFDTLKVQGTLGVLRYLGKPAIIRDCEIENLKILIGGGAELEVVSAPVFEKGDAVEVIEGLFKGLKGYSLNIKGKHRIVVEIETIGSRLAVNVPLDFVRKNTSLSYI